VTAPIEVRRSLTLPPESLLQFGTPLTDPYAVKTPRPPKTHRLRPHRASRLQENNGDLIQHSFWLFDSEEKARSTEATFNQLRDMPDAPATFLSVDV
jgi:hypothetical protein